MNLEGVCVGSKTESITVRVLLAVGLGVAVSSVEKACHASPSSTAPCPSWFFIQVHFLALSYWPFLLATTNSATTSSSEGRLSSLLIAWFDASSQ